MTWYNASWLHRKKITIAQSQVDADLTDFPVMVELADADILAAARGYSSNIRSAAVALNDTVLPAAPNGRLYKCTTAAHSFAGRGADGAGRQLSVRG